MLKLFITPERGIRQTMFERDKYIIWEAGEVIYRAGDPSNEAFLIMEGSVQIFTSEGLLLNRIGTNEILGETSLLLNVIPSAPSPRSPPRPAPRQPVFQGSISKISPRATGLRAR